ncbi:MAG TPA: S-methyl-5-thioribose-1-phosphate isomerase, partial [Burkholderiales bacterium]
MSASSEATGVETLRWSGGRLELIDQRGLPRRLDYVSCGSAAEVAAAIRDMVVRGAPAIGCAAAFGVALEALRHRDRRREEQDAALESAFAALAASRPTAVNLFWALDRMREALAAARDAAAPAVADRLLRAAQEIMAADLATNRAIGAAGAALVPQVARIMTHCNAGALATAGHGTALGVVRTARDQGKRISVIASE